MPQWVKFSAVGEARSILLKVEVTQESEVFDVLTQVASMSNNNICNLTLAASPLNEETEREIAMDQKTSQLKPSSAWNVKVRQQISRAQPNTPRSIIRKTSSIDQNDIEKVRAKALELGIVLRAGEENDEEDPIHDTNTTGGISKYNTSRKAFNKKFTQQFFHAESETLWLRDVASQYSRKHLNLVWQKLDLGDEAQAIANIQNGI